MDLHIALLAHAERQHAADLAMAPQLTQDALTLTLKNGIILSVRYAAPDAYSLRWHSGADRSGAELGIDTAPTHPHLATTPNHLHLPDGRVIADPLTRIGATPEDNLSAVITAILVDPLVQAHA